MCVVWHLCCSHADLLSKPLVCKHDPHCTRFPDIFLHMSVCLLMLKELAKVYPARPLGRKLLFSCHTWYIVSVLPSVKGVAVRTQDLCLALHWYITILVPWFGVFSTGTLGKDQTHLPMIKFLTWRQFPPLCLSTQVIFIPIASPCYSTLMNSISKLI